MNTSTLEKAMRSALHNEAGLRTLWRMNGGNLDKARKTVKALVPHYTLCPDALNPTEQDFNMSFDIVCGELNNDVEVEWAS